MQKESDIFDRHYDQYCSQVAAVDFESVKDRLKVEYEKGRLRIPFYDQTFWMSKDGIEDEFGNQPNYGVCVILFKYVLLCPERQHQDEQWVAFRDFKKDAFLTNLNFFSSDTEQAIVKHFQGRLPELSAACEKLGGVQYDVGIHYDVSMKFDVLPMISQLLLFNDEDASFPCRCSVLYHKHTEYYLDPESLAMTGAALAKNLIIKMSEN